MSPSKISRRIFLDRIAWIDRMIAQIRALPLADRAAFLADSRNVFTAESCIRRALEALFDLGRHVMARGFGVGVTEYKEIAENLGSQGVLSATHAGLMKILAGYRNRLVHFYHEVSADELFEICSTELNDVISLQDELRRWLGSHPDLVDSAL
jgi:uncharacterized protein YutE (UPF0331/DUF86 family)